MPGACVRCGSAGGATAAGADLKKVYGSATLAGAEAEFADFAQTWRPKYPAMVAMWERSWPEFGACQDFCVS